MRADGVRGGERLGVRLGGCAVCGSPATLADAVPLAGWARMRRQCQECREAFGAWYPAAGVTTAAAAAAMWLRFGPAPEVPAFFYLAVGGVALAFLGARVQPLPGVLTLPS